jgi:hypothetical protein
LRIKNKKIIEEITVFDEVALYANLFKAHALVNKSQWEENA